MNVRDETLARANEYKKNLRFFFSLCILYIYTFGTFLLIPRGILTGKYHTFFTV